MAVSRCENCLGPTAQGRQRGAQTKEHISPTGELDLILLEVVIEKTPHEKVKGKVLLSLRTCRKGLSIVSDGRGTVRSSRVGGQNYLFSRMF